MAGKVLNIVLGNNATDVRHKLSGHKSSTTTKIYTHVAQRNLEAIKSPLGKL